MCLGAWELVLLFWCVCVCVCVCVELVFGVCGLVLVREGWFWCVFGCVGVGFGVWLVCGNWFWCVGVLFPCVRVGSGVFGCVGVGFGILVCVCV